MLYFIPAWYRQNQWCENEQKWYERRTHTEFDDTVKHMQLFHRSQAYPYRILLLSYSPNFRHFLHRQGVYHAPYWSCFDAIQQIRRTKAALLSFHNLKWPPHTEFLYTPFVVVAMCRGEKYAQIEFGEDGNPIQIDLYDHGALCRRNVYDDRGFLSGTAVYREGTLFRQDYLMENGIWKLRHFQSDGHVEINPKYPAYLIAGGAGTEERCFSRLSYDSMEQVIYEVFLAYLVQADKRDLFCVAMHDRHRELMERALKGKRVILSFFEDRYPCEEHPESQELLKMAGCIVADSPENLERVKMAALARGADKMFKDIPPYDTRVDFGISQQLDVQNILVPVDGLGDLVFGELVRKLGAYLLTNENARVCLFTRKADYGREQHLLEQTGRCLSEAGLAECRAAEEKEKHSAENYPETAVSVPARFLTAQCVDELSVSKCMREQRIIVDLREPPELYLQVMALSVGIPQIVAAKTQFVNHGGNGFVLKELNRLPGLLAYYLESLKNWNDAVVCSYELGKKYTTKVLLRKWREVIDCFEENPNTAIGRQRLE